MRDAHLGESLDQRRRRHDEAEPQRRRQDLRERAHVDDDAVAIGRGERQHRAPLVVELVVVVVLDDGDAPRARQLEEAQPPPGVEHHRGRVLMVRRHVDRAQLLARGQRLERVDVEAALVDGHRHQARAGGAERAPRRPIAERLDRDDVARREQRARYEIERHLAAARHHQRVDVGGDAAQRRQHVAERARAAARGRARRHSRAARRRDA